MSRMYLKKVFQCYTAGKMLDSKFPPFVMLTCWKQNMSVGS
jgi:hypothetical protein